MKIVTILGTRPELIRLSRIIPKLDKLTDHVVVHTGQNYDYNLDKVFRDELNIREPNYYLDARGSFSQQIAQILTGLEDVLLKEKPDAFLVLGDTNSSLGAIVAKRMGIRVFHMEAGNRCHDERSPEEVNRRIIDHCSDTLLPYTEHSRRNLLDEGIPNRRIYVTGNPISEVINHYTTPEQHIYYRGQKSMAPFALVTLHRQENVDDPKRLAGFIKAFNALDQRIIWPMHPRTKKQLSKTKLAANIKVTDPMGFIEFVTNERNAEMVLTDSGTVQEECAIFGTPVITLRDSTERPETLETGSNIVSGGAPASIELAIRAAKELRSGTAPEGYVKYNVSDTVIKIILGHQL